MTKKEFKKYFKSISSSMTIQDQLKLLDTISKEWCPLLKKNIYNIYMKCSDCNKWFKISDCEKNTNS